MNINRQNRVIYGFISLYSNSYVAFHTCIEGLREGYLTLYDGTILYNKVWLTTSPLPYMVTDYVTVLKN